MGEPWIDSYFAVVTDYSRKFVLAVATKDDLDTFVKRRGKALDSFPSLPYAWYVYYGYWHLWVHNEPQEVAMYFRCPFTASLVQSSTLIWHPPLSTVLLTLMYIQDANATCPGCFDFRRLSQCCWPNQNAIRSIWPQNENQTWYKLVFLTRPYQSLRHDSSFQI